MLQKADQMIRFPEKYSRDEIMAMKDKLEYCVLGMLKNHQKLDKNALMVEKLIETCLAKIDILQTCYETEDL